MQLNNVLTRKLVDDAENPNILSPIASSSAAFPTGSNHVLILTLYSLAIRNLGIFSK